MYLVCRLLLPLAPRSTLFPYTTLFRSSDKNQLFVRPKGDHNGHPACLDPVAPRPPLEIRSPDDSAPKNVLAVHGREVVSEHFLLGMPRVDRKSTRLNSSHRCISYAVFCFR